MPFKPIHHWFSQNAEQYHDRIAVDDTRKKVTYGELEKNSNSLANFLLNSGASDGDKVAILLKEPADVILAIIASLKTGCIFIPLDIRSPAKRLEVMLAQVTPQWFVTEKEFMPVIEKFTTSGTKAVIYLDDTGLEGKGDTKLPAVPSQPDDPSYIYFTSGTTGTPKGIVGRLKAIDHFIRWEIKTLNLGEGTRVSQLTAPSFDAFLRDIFVPLCTGGTICIPEDDNTILDPLLLLHWLDEQEVNLVHCVPSLFRSLLNTERLDSKSLSSLNHILMAGESLPVSDVQRWYDLVGDRVQLVNLYGPTETTMTKFYYFVQPSDSQRRSIPIGKPMEGARALIVDEKGKPCPPGVVGEIYIRTPYVTLGYYEQPELTQEAFIQNPFSQKPGDIVYKTGDLGRIADDDNFEFLGRKDQQVKIRGVRIEVAEIESFLRSHELVNDVAVVDREDSADNKYLCAYVVLKRNIDASSLREYLSNHLPEFMLPSMFVQIDTLPQTSNGKVDRSALPAPDRDHELQEAFVPPRTPLEEKLAKIWSDVLNIERVGIHDNFFELGGHSLLATQVISRLRNALNLPISLRHLFEKPTIAALAVAITQSQAAAEDQDELNQILSELEQMSDE